MRFGAPTELFRGDRMLKIEIINWSTYNGRTDCKATWLRLENKLFESDDLHGFEAVDFAVWVFLLCQASKRGTKEFCLRFELVCDRLKLDRPRVHLAIDKLQESGLINVQERPRPSTDADVRSYARTPRGLRTNERTIQDERTNMAIAPAKAGADFDHFEVLENPVTIYADAYKARYGHSPEIGGKQAGILKRFSKNHKSKAKLLIEGYLKMPDIWATQRSHPVELLETKLNEIVRFLATGKVVTNADKQKMNETLDKAMGPKPPTIQEILAKKEKQVEGKK